MVGGRVWSGGPLVAGVCGLSLTAVVDSRAVTAVAVSVGALAHTSLVIVIVYRVVIVVVLFRHGCAVSL